MGRSSQINVLQCPTCGGESESAWCYECRIRRQSKSREKRRVVSKYKVIDWFSSRSSAGLIVEDSAGNQYPIYMSDVFRFVNGTDFGQLTLEETKKGSAYGWRILDEEEAVN